MSGIASYILELLSRDMVSHGLLLQSVNQYDSRISRTAVLTELLSGDVEIGEARLTSPDYVEFVAWTGGIQQRISRAEARVDSLTGPDQEFAYWLAMRKNVDRFEGAGITV
jgi:hypothetical protein